MRDSRRARRVVVLGLTAAAAPLTFASCDAGGGGDDRGTDSPVSVRGSLSIDEDRSCAYVTTDDGRYGLVLDSRSGLAIADDGGLTVLGSGGRIVALGHSGSTFETAALRVGPEALPEPCRTDVVAGLIPTPTASVKVELVPSSGR